jgi:two-component system response regulator QseB
MLLDGTGRAAPRLLLVEDDDELSALLVRLLTDEGYAVTRAPDGQAALHLGLTQAFDLTVLDRAMPVRDGLTVLAAWRDRGVSMPALILSARGSTEDRIAGLDAGAEDYLVKPFDIGELLARLRALQRRHVEASTVLPVGGWFLDVDACVVRRERGLSAADPGDIWLSPREARLLATLAARPLRVFTAAELLDRVFEDAQQENTVQTYVSYCRRKLGPQVIRTVRGIGYQIGRA